MPAKKQRKRENKKKTKKPCSKNDVKAICSEMRRTEPELQPPDPMEDPLYRYRQPKLIDFEKILDPDPLFPEGNIVILLKLLKKKAIPGLLDVEYDWYGL